MMKRDTHTNVQENTSVPPSKNHDNASAEMIGSIILIGLFVAVFGIILVTMTSSTSDFVVPAVVIEPQPIKEQNGWYVLDLRAGDTLLRNATRIIVDGRDRTAEFMEGTSSGPGATVWEQWGSGDSLYLEYSSLEQPKALQIIYYTPEGDGVLLWELGSTENRVPEAAFSANVTQGISPLTVQFTDASSNGVTSWLWDFGDGTTSTEQNPVHTYASAGEYTVRLTVKNQYDEDIFVKPDYIHVADPFTVDFIADPLSGIGPLMVNFTDMSSGTPTSWHWDFGDGSTSNHQNPSHTYLFSGLYNVTLQASVNGVEKTEEKPAYITVTDVCLPGLYGTYVDEFNDDYRVPFSGIPSYRIDPRLWFADDSSGKESDEVNWPVGLLGKTNQFSVTHEGYLIVPANGTYTLYLTSDDGSVIWLDNVLDSSPVLIDNWGSGGLHSLKEVQATVSLTKGKHPIRVKMTENWGGAVLRLEWKSDTITREPIESFCYVPGGLTVVDFTARPLSGTVPLKVEFTDLSIGPITSWAWDFGDGTTSTEQNPVHTYSAAGVYSVTLVVSDGTVSYTEEKTDYIYVTDGCLPGLSGTYYDEYNSAYMVPFSGNTVTRTDPRIWFADSASGEESDEANWPVATIGKANTFSVVYEGYLIVPKDELYTFHLRSDDGSVLWIDNTADLDTVLIDNWGLHSATTKSASKSLTTGKHPIRIKMTENSGNAVLHLEWESASIPRQPVESFCHGSGTLLSADFVANPLNGTRPLNVQFNSTVTGTAPITYAWDFGDETISALQNPAHIYAAPGQYTVSLTVTDATLSAVTEVKDQYITVTGMPLPVAWWRFDEASGNTAVDSSGNGNDGAIAGGIVDRRSGACGTGLYFDGTTTWVNVPDDDTLSFNDSFTFAGWFRPEVPEILSVPGEYKYFTQIIGKGYDRYGSHQYSNNYEIFLRTQNDLLQFEANGEADASSEQAFTSDASGLPVSYNDWFHLAVVVDGGVGLVYVDGNQVSSFSVDRTPLKENSEPVSIGKQIASIDWAEFYYKGMMDELYLFGAVLTPDEISSLAGACTPIPWEAPGVSFSAAPVTGNAPLDVQFNSTVTGTAPLTYAWTFGDGATSTEQNPVHTYTTSGMYSVNLTVSNPYGVDTLERIDYIEVTGGSFADYIVNENVFVYGNSMTFSGSSVSGPGATIHINGGLNRKDLNGNAKIDVSTIYVDGPIDLNSGSASLGSETSPGLIYVNGDLTLRNGVRHIYGDVYVNGNFLLKDAVIHGNVYVNGDLTLRPEPVIYGKVFYTGAFDCPNSIDSSTRNKCVKVAAVPGFVIPDHNMPSVKSNDFYSDQGYVSGGALVSNVKIFADSYSSTTSRPSAENVIIVAKSGDITLTGLGGSGVTGILFAPNGKVTFNGGSFEGLVIARDGFDVTSGGTMVTFKNMDEYISNPANYPF